MPNSGVGVENEKTDGLEQRAMFIAILEDKTLED